MDRLRQRDQLRSSPLGHSGNPAGKPRGAKDKRTALRELLQPHSEKLIGKVVELALIGDTTALRICIDRLIAPIRSKDTPVSIGKLDGSSSEKGLTVINALADGCITPDEAATIMQVISAQTRIVQIDEFEKRIAALEARQIEK